MKAKNSRGSFRKWEGEDDRTLIHHIQSVTMPAAAAKEMHRSREDVFLRTMEMGLRLRGWRDLSPGIVAAAASSKPIAERLAVICDAEQDAYGSLEFLAQFLRVSEEDLSGFASQIDKTEDFSEKQGKALLKMAKTGKFANLKALADEWGRSFVDVVTKANALSVALEARGGWSKAAVAAMLAGNEMTHQQFAYKYKVSEKEVRVRDAVLHRLKIRPAMDRNFGFGVQSRESVRRHMETLDEWSGRLEEERDAHFSQKLKEIGPMFGIVDAADVLGVDARYAKALWSKMQEKGEVNPIKAIRQPDPISQPEIDAVKSMVKDNQSTAAIAKLLRRDVAWMDEWLKANPL
ncbi:hypothetical protein [Alcanivorax sp. 1008]|uniref:hypothetical protein n=1 Tax=Alcanivorax sp. 1008 TaxID=2816853 RepID=UPI001D4C32EF|nr:hypothetical protein [Alcanivorax sp. 1008]MCC1496749.1 hypothetical protein [Alcanivorax sp. 1008]